MPEQATTVSHTEPGNAADLLTEFDTPDFAGASPATSIAVSQFDTAYRAKPPWDIDGPQPAFARLLQAGLIHGPVLDIGCGTGENALHFASGGLDVTGLDASAVAIGQAQAKARQRRLPARFVLGDALQLTALGETFSTVTDSGLLHVLSDHDMQQVIRGIHAVLRPSGHYWLLCFSEHAAGPGPRKLTKQHISTLFNADWEINDIQPARFQPVPGRGYEQMTAAWLADVQRRRPAMTRAYPGPRPAEATAGISGGPAAMSVERTPQISIYDRIGGAPAVRAAVDDFSARVLADTRLGAFFTGTDLHRLKAHQRAFIAAAIGGPEVFGGRDMASAHAGLSIGDGDFDAVVGHLAGTLTGLGVPEDTIGQIAAALAPLRGDIVTTPPAGLAGMSQDASAVYSLGSSEGESVRLLRQADELTPESQMLLDRAGLRPGQAAVDLGCGPRGVLELLAARVSPGGRVVGIDADPAHVAMAAGFAAERGLDGVEVMAADARCTGLPSGSFDLVHTRTLLVNVPEPAQVAAEMVRLARPGGQVASLEPDCEYELCYPPHPAITRIREIFPVVFARNGADPNIGRRVPELFRQAGLAGVEVEATVRVYPRGHSRRAILLDLVQSMRPRVLELGLASRAELDDLDAAARAHLDDPHTVVMSHPFFQTWGRKPA